MTQTVKKPDLPGRATDVGKQRRGLKGGLIAVTAAVVVIVATVGLYSLADSEPPHAPVPPLPSEQLSREELLEDLVNRGLVPKQALDPAPGSREALMRDLVNRGLIPSQSLND